MAAFLPRAVHVTVRLTLHFFARAFHTGLLAAFFCCLSACHGESNDTGDLDSGAPDGPGSTADIGPGFFKGGIFVVGGQDLITGVQVQRLGDDVQGEGCVGQADQIVGGGSQDCRKGGADVAHPTA